MDETRSERWDAGSGLAALVIGAVGGALERGWPSASDPAAVTTFIATNRTGVLAQSMAFVLSAGFFLWFFGGLRSFLIRRERGNGRLSTMAFGAGVVWAGLQMVAQAFQVGVAIAPGGELEPTFLWTMAAMFSIANLPLAVMLFATALVTFQTHAFPIWLGWLSVVAAVAQMLLFAGTVVRSGPLAPNGWLTYALYPVIAVWLLPTTLVMIRQAGKLSSAELQGPA
jgi:hypothetical protein